MKKILMHITLVNVFKVLIIAGLFTLAVHWDLMGIIPMGIGVLIMVETKW